MEKVPSKDAGDLYIRYAKLEEQHGLVRHAASVMDRACAVVEESERLDMFRLYVAKASAVTPKESRGGGTRSTNRTGRW